MKIAVLMSTYNGEKYLKPQIDSILNQEGDFEINLIVRDDGSDDGTVDILNKYQDDGKLNWYKGPKLGSAKSFMDLVINNNGYDLYAFADQDDFWYPNKLKEGAKRINLKKPQIFLCNSEIVDADLNSLNQNRYPNPPICDAYSVLCNGGLQGCAMIFNNALADVIRNCDIPELITNHDSYIARVCTAIGGSIIYDDASYFKYRRHGSNVIGIKIGMREKIKDRLNEIFTKEKISITIIAKDIFIKYEDLMNQDTKDFYMQVINYKVNIVSRFKLAFSSKVHYRNRTWSMTNRLKIILGNK